MYRVCERIIDRIVSLSFIYIALSIDNCLPCIMYSLFHRHYGERSSADAISQICSRLAEDILTTGIKNVFSYFLDNKNNTVCVHLHI